MSDPAPFRSGGLPMRPAALLRRLEDGLLVVLVAALLGLCTAQIALRSLFSVTLSWVDPLTRHLVVWAGLLGAAAASREDRQVRIDALLRLPSPGFRAWAALICEGTTAAVCAGLAAVSVRFIAIERTMGIAAMPGVPAWVAQLFYPFCFGLMACRHAARAAGGGRAIAGRSPRP